jgi:hypothetical protein
MVPLSTIRGGVEKITLKLLLEQVKIKVGKTKKVRN